jgi:gas vesicle protein
MPQRDTIDFLTAFAVGAVLGAGAALLLRPEPPSRTQRLLKELDPYRRKVRKTAARARKGFREGAAATLDLGSEVAAAGRDVLREFRKEVAEVLADARDELGQIVQEELKKALKRARRAT